MRIAIDAYVLHEMQPAGMANFTANLLRGLASTESEDEYILLTPSVRNTVLAEELSGNPRFRIIQTGAAFGSSRRIWLQSPRATISRGISGWKSWRCRWTRGTGSISMRWKP